MNYTFLIKSEIYFIITLAFVKVTVQELGSIISNHRKRLHLSQAYVAELAGMSSRQLLEWEAGRGNPSFEQLQAVLAVIGLVLKIEPKQVA